jgi:hypothetical protein
MIRIAHWKPLGVLGSATICLAFAYMTQARPVLTKEHEARSFKSLERGGEPLARFFPKEHLVVLAEFEGLSVRGDDWEKTAARAILHETPTGSMLRRLSERLLSAAFERSGSVPLSPKEVLELAEHALSRGFAVGIVRAPEEEKPSVVTLVVRDVTPQIMALGMRKLLDAFQGPRVKATNVERKGRQITTIVLNDMPSVAWWLEETDLVVSFAGVEGAEKTLEVLEHPGQSALEHPVRNRLRTPSNGLAPVGWAYFEMAALPPLPEPYQRMGLAGVRRLEYVWGVDGPALKTVVAIDAPAPRSGLLALMEASTIDLKKLPPLPADANSLTVFSLEPGRFLRQVLELEARAGSQSLKQGVNDVSENLKERIERDLFNDLLDPIGPTWVAYATSPSEGPRTAGPLLGFFSGLTQPPRGVLVAELSSPEAYSSTLDALMPELNKDLSGLTERMRSSGLEVENGFNSAPVPTRVQMFDRSAPDISIPIPPPVPREEVEKKSSEAEKPQAAEIFSGLVVMQKPGEAGPQFVKLRAPLNGWTLDQPLSGSILWGAGARPTVVVGKHHLILGSTYEAAKQALDLETHPAAPAATNSLEATLRKRLSEGVTFCHVSDPRRSILPEVVSNLPALLQSAPLGRSGFMNLDGGRPSIFPAFSQLLGLPLGAPWLNLKFLPDELPTAAQIRSRLFPAIHSFAVDDQGFRIESREAFPSFNPLMLGPLAVAGLLPAILTTRESAQRVQSVNNLKQIGLAIHNFQSSNNRLPADIRDADGKPLLSWRVQLLPFLEQQGLFEALHKDEPWDSAHNKELLEHMPALFKIPGSAQVEPGHTFYRGFSGPHAMFDFQVQRGLNFEDITDGTSNTLVVVEAREGVPWTKPDSDIPFDGDADALQGNDLRPSLGGHFGGGFNALLLDGSVRFIRETLAPQTLRALISRDGGEVISHDSF